MSVVAGSARVVLSGTGYSPEIWATGFWVSAAALTTSQECTDFADTVHVKAVDSGFKTSLLNVIGPGFNWNKVTVYSHESGNPAADHVGEFAVPSGTGSNQTGLNQISQVCMVATLKTDTAGRTGRGRMFIPAAGQPVANGRFNTVSRNTLCDNLAAMFTLINALTDTSAIVGVFSNAASAIRPVTSVVIDDKPDIQRRRANRFQAASLRSANVT